MSYKKNTKNYTSGMVQSWNKFCFTGGVLELSVQLPGGSANASGLWPAAWLMGNLGRATFGDTTTDLWPWSYDTCGDIPNLDDKQKINACTSAKYAEKYGMHPNQGRGAPEIDIFEVMMGHEMPVVPPGVDPTTVSPPFKYEHIRSFMSTSLQVAPGMSSSTRPVNGVPLSMNQSAQWYSDLHLSRTTELNYAFYGAPAGKIGKSYMEDAISANTPLSNTHFLESHIYRLEWQPGPDGYLHWFVDSTHVFGIEAKSLEKATGAMIPEEPSYLILNTAVSHVWGFPEPCDGVDKLTCSACWECYDCTNPDCQCSLPDAMRGCNNLPAVMKVDFVRLYQDVDDPLHSVGCSTPSHPTAQFIAGFSHRYADWSPLVPKEYNVLVTVVHFLVLFLLFLSLVYSARYLCNPRYRTIGDVKTASRSARTSNSNSPNRSASANRSSARKDKSKRDVEKGSMLIGENMVSETTSLLSSRA